MQGVQPTAKATPAMRAVGRLPPCRIESRRSAASSRGSGRPAKVEGGQDDEDAGCDLQRAAVLEQRAAEPRHAGTEEHEHRGEAEDERRRVRHDPPWTRAQLVEADPGDEREVARDERQDAGRRERDEARSEGDRETGRAELDHPAPPVTSSSPCSKPSSVVSPATRPTTDGPRRERRSSASPGGPAPLASSPRGSAMLGKSPPISSWRAAASAALSWKLTPTTAASGWASAKLTSAGSSARQVAHQEAQKLRTTGLPAKSASATASPVIGSVPASATGALVARGLADRVSAVGYRLGDLAVPGEQDARCDDRRRPPPTTSSPSPDAPAVRSPGVRRPRTDPGENGLGELGRAAGLPPSERPEAARSSPAGCGGSRDSARSGRDAGQTRRRRSPRSSPSSVRGQSAPRSCGRSPRAE